jgi:nicotinamidase-related amidase
VTDRELTINCVSGRAFAMPVARAALLVIDMQRDFCCEDGYGAKSGGSIAPIRAIVPNVAAILAAARALGLMIVHTREGHVPDLSDCPPAKLARSRNADAEIGSQGPMGRLLVRGEYGHDFIDELQPAPGESVIDKPGFGAFYATTLADQLKARAITHLLFTGVTSDVCVHTTLREAVDRGYRCLTFEDATATFDDEIHRIAMKMISVEGGIFGEVCSTRTFLSAL